MEASVGTVLVAVVAVVVVCCLLLFRRRGGSKKSRFQGDTIVFLGNTGAGKSVLFSQLFRGKVPETVNSIEEEHLENARLISREEQREARTAAAAAATAKDQTPFHAVCLPGNRRLRSMYHKHLPRAAGIVLVVDASDPDIKGTAAFLHELLVDKVVDKQCPPILLACTKNDVAKRRKEDFPAYFINSLEAELDILKKSQNSGSWMPDGTITCFFVLLLVAAMVAPAPYLVLRERLVVVRAVSCAQATGPRLFLV